MSFHPAQEAFHPNSIVSRWPLSNPIGMMTRFAALLLILLMCAGCGGHSSEKVISGLPEAGALYSLFDGEGGYRFGKVILVENEVIFLHLLEGRWQKRPSLSEFPKATKALPVAYKPGSFWDMKPVKLKQSTVTPEEKETYEAWKSGNEEVF